MDFVIYWLIAMMYGINVEKMNLYIIVYAKFDGNQLNIKVKNSRSRKRRINKLGNKYLTSKNNKSTHGYGLQVIESIAKKYDGKMMISYGDGWFCNEVANLKTMEEPMNI